MSTESRPLGDNEISSKVLKYETFVNDVLKEQLRNTHDALDKSTSEIAEYVQLKNFIESCISTGLDKEGFKSQVDVGCNFFLEAKVDDPSKILLAIGLGCYVEYALSEALVVIEKRMNVLNKKCEVYRKQSADTKAHIKLVLLGLRELQGLK